PVRLQHVARYVEDHLGDLPVRCQLPKLERQFERIENAVRGEVDLLAVGPVDLDPRDDVAFALLVFALGSRDDGRRLRAGGCGPARGGWGRGSSRAPLGSAPPACASAARTCDETRARRQSLPPCRPPAAPGSGPSCRPVDATVCSIQSSPCVRYPDCAGPRAA